MSDLEIILAFCNFGNDDCQHDSRVLHTFVHNKSFGQLQDITPKKLLIKKHLIQNDKNSKLLEREDKTNITLVHNWSVKYKK